MYRTVQGDTWDKIAKVVYGDELQAGFLMSQNYPLLDYFIFPANIELNTPDLPEEGIGELPAWRD